MFFGSIDYIGHTNAANSDVSVDIGQVLSMRVTKNNADITELNLDVDPLPTGRFIKDHLSVLVSTSNTTGYTLTMADNDTNTALTHTDVTVTDAINSITTTPSDPNATTMESNFPTNSWAYGLGDPTSTAQTFFRIPLPSAADTIKTTSTAATDDPTQVTFAAKVDTNLTAGTYQDTVIFSATPNYVPRTLTDITTMQQMSSEICANTPTPSVTETNVPEVTLLDVRGKDGTGTIENPATGTNQQTYLVRKLADGNCWMAQNLNLNLSTAVSLNNTTTDLNSKTFWTPAVSTQTAVGTTWAQDGADGIHSFEPGDIYFPNGVGTGTADTYGNLTGATSGAAYWHIGNYYNWPAATAASGTATMVAPDTAPDSICPKGWKLPDNEGTKSFVNLVFTTYGLQDNDATSSTKLLAAPLNFVRSGFYDWSNGQVYNKGARGHWWSTAAYSTATGARSLSTDSTRVIPQYAHYKGYGFTVRCVAR